MEVARSRGLRGRARQVEGLSSGRLHARFVWLSFAFAANPGRTLKDQASWVIGSGLAAADELVCRTVFLQSGAGKQIVSCRQEGRHNRHNYKNMVLFGLALLDSPTWVAAA